jgi:Zn finger protein HypA/HybF involved in hydrogenase expression
VPLLARILESARIQALLGGLIRITCIEMRIGTDSAIDPEAIASAMEERFQGDLLEKCKVEIEVVEGNQVQLKSIEGVPFQARDAI